MKNLLVDMIEFDDTLYFFKDEAAKRKYYDKQLKKWLKIETPFFCWDEETQQRLDEMAETVADWLESESICLAERRMGAVSLGYDAYDVQDDSGEYSICMKHAIDRAYHAHIERYRAPRENDIDWISDDELPF